MVLHGLPYSKTGTQLSEQHLEDCIKRTLPRFTDELGEVFAQPGSCGDGISLLALQFVHKYGLAKRTDYP